MSDKLHWSIRGSVRQQESSLPAGLASTEMLAYLVMVTTVNWGEGEGEGEDVDEVEVLVASRTGRFYTHACIQCVCIQCIESVYRVSVSCQCIESAYRVSVLSQCIRIVPVY